jgi:hypothetical protein
MWGGRIGNRINTSGHIIMANYLVMAKIRLEIETNNKNDTKQVMIEDVSDSLRHNIFTYFMKL